MKPRKRKIPYLFRRKLSCPDCGFIFSEHSVIETEKYFNCPCCGQRFGNEFWEENYDKWKYTIKEDEN